MMNGQSVKKHGMVTFFGIMSALVFVSSGSVHALCSCGTPPGGGKLGNEFTRRSLPVEPRSNWPQEAYFNMPNPSRGRQRPEYTEIPQSMRRLPGQDIGGNQRLRQGLLDNY